MKTKYLLMTAALSGLFAACTQEDFLDAPATPATDPLAGRPVVGVVDFKTDEPTTRYNAETATPDVGDALGLYLMDEFRGAIIGEEPYLKGEKDDANETLFTYQSNWWTMYSPVNYIQSNYGYVLQEDGKWINRASQLVEGNYIVMYRKNDEATNRRDLWQYINPNVELKHHSTRTDKYYVNRDNQFMLDYKQIYRDQKADETGKLTIDVKFKPILTYAKFVIENQASNNFIAEKIVFKAPGDKPLPTVAYVKPVGVMPQFIEDKYNEITEADGTIDVLKDECGNTIAEGLYYDEYFTQKIARSMVHYATTEKQVPYGLEDTNTAFEYVFNFPDEEEGGVLLKANNTGDPSDRVLGVSIALPAFAEKDMGFDWTQMQVVVYGKMWDPGSNDMKGSWRPGVLIDLRGTADNQIFDLNKFKLWESGMEIPTAQLKFDDQSFVQGEEIRVQTTDDLINLISSRLSSITTTQDVKFEVYPYGNGLEITDEVVSLIDTYKKEHGVNVTLIFKHTLGDHNNTPVILKAENSINKFKYKGVNVVVEADQVSEEKVDGINDLHIFKSLTLAKDANLTASNIHVELGGSLNAGACNVKANTIENSGTFVLEGSTVTANIENNAQMNVTKDATITGNITNDNDCINCGKDDAVVTIEEAATLTVNGNIMNMDTFDNNGVLNVEKIFTNTGRFETADAFIWRIENGEYNYKTDEGSIYINGTVTLISNDPWSENKGYIYIYPEAKLIGINTSDTFIKNEKEGSIANNGMLHQVSNDGSIVTGEGSYTREMGGTGTINNSSMADVVYGTAQICQYLVEDVTGMTIKELQDNVTKAKANQLWIQSGTLKPYTDNTLAGVDGSFTNGVIFGAVTFEGGKQLQIVTNQLSFGQPSTIKDGELVIYDLKAGSSKTSATLVVAEPAKLTIEQGATLRGSKESGLEITNYGTIHNAGTVSYILNATECQEGNEHWSGNSATGMY